MMQHHRKILLFVILLLVAVGASGLFIITTHAVDVDVVPHRDHGANGVKEVPDPPKSDINDIFPPFTTDFGTIISGLKFKFDSIQDLGNVIGGQQSTIQPPAVNIAMLVNLGPGTVASINAQSLGFQSEPASQFYNWCFGTQGRRITQNGVVAGGTMLRMDDAGNGSDCYDRVTRDPAKEGDVDSLHDGMGDRWKQRYFGTLYVNPLEDKDRDGYALTITNGFKGLDGVINLVPDSFSSKDTFHTCDGFFPNGEEYIWGTNPIDPDSDDDGYSDEEDVCGHAQTSFPYLVPQVSANQQNVFVEVITDGLSNVGLGLTQTPLTKIANAAKVLQFDSSRPFKASIEYRIVGQDVVDPSEQKDFPTNSEAVYVNDTAEFHANVSGAVGKESNLHYQWTFQLLDGGVHHPNAPETVLATVGPLPSGFGVDDPVIGRNGYGLNPYRLHVAPGSSTADTAAFGSVSPETGNYIRVSVLVSEPETGKSYTTSSSFPIAISTTLDFLPALPVLPLMRGALPSSAAFYTVNANTTGLNPNDFLFEWYLDDTAQPNAKVGGATMKFQAVKSSGSYKIRLVMTKVATGTQFATIETKAEVKPLNATIPNCLEYSEKNDLLAGTKIPLRGAFESTGIFPGSLRYQWFVNDFAATDVTETPQPTYNFTASAGGVYEIKYTVSSVPPDQAGATNYVPFFTTGICKLQLLSEPLTIVQGMQKRLASALASFPAFAKSVSGYAVVIVIIVLALFGIRRFLLKKSL